MSTTITNRTTDIDFAPSSWQSWESPMDVDYSATLIWTSLPQTTLSPALRGGAMAMALAGLGITGGSGLNAWVGSGGSMEHLIRQDQSHATATSPEILGSLLAAVEETEARAESSKAANTEVFGTADLIADIKATLGVNVTDLATIAKVSRQSIYEWLGGAQISPANYERLYQIRQICSDWQTLATKPVGRLLYAKGGKDASLFELLGREDLNPTAIRAQLEILAAKMAQHDAQRQHRLAKLSPLSDRDQRENALTHVSSATDS